ncbi:hypothetical protein C0Q70_11859 [Pomacea canaliculata]|uniref:Uncharacterized protein n=1 Tax=Pomacea canaliculata TaxID=400727 RepID=A0A2T7P762_POMCA|nr:hypothetical protein C0Q70_11859 [Pomacea canaliculata]
MESLAAGFVNCQHDIYSNPLFYPESPRWLVSRGRRQEASAIERHAALVNKVVVSEKVLSLQDLQNDGPGVKFWQLFTHPRLLVRCLIVFFNWINGGDFGNGVDANVDNDGEKEYRCDNNRLSTRFVVTCVYYGLGLNVGSLSGDIYMNFLYASIAETLSYVLCLVAQLVDILPSGYNGATASSIRLH